MADLKTRYMGLELSNPVIAGSSGITGSIDGIKQCADAGAGAVVLKSMFEELIIAENDELDHDLIQAEHPEAFDYIRAEIGKRFGSRPYLKFIEDARANTAIPIIASVNCVSAKWWISYAKEIESAGAHGLELNITHFPVLGGEKSADIEARYAAIVHEVVANVSIPVAVKVMPQFTSLFNVLGSLAGAGAKALVLFNRNYHVDVDLKTLKAVPSASLSCPSDISDTLRWTGLVSRQIKCDIAATTGIHDGKTALKAILMGATAVQVASALYQHGPAYIGEILSEMNGWLDGNGYLSIGDVRCQAHAKTPDEDVLLKRIQYVKAIEESGK